LNFPSLVGAEAFGEDAALLEVVIGLLIVVPI
jgi:hypothetical protein